MNDARVRAHERSLFLDGIRGWASLMVFFSHFLVFFLSNTIPEFQGWIFGFASDGNFAIFIFLVLSGFALSIGYIQSGNFKALSALAIRRYFRLAIPVFFSCFFAYLLLKFNLFYNKEAGNITGNTWLTGFYNFPPDFLNSVMISLQGVFIGNDRGTPYNPVLWTMSIELLGSFVVFAACAIVMQTRKKLLILTAFIFYLWMANSIWNIPFVCGICIALCYSRAQHAHTKYFTYAAPVVISLVIYYSSSTMRGGILGLPAMPRSDLLSIIAASALVLVATRTPFIKAFFQNRLSVYLGSISFPLYLTHFLVICSFSSFLFIQFEKLGFGRDRNNFINLVLSVIACLVIAHFFRHLENFAIWLARRFSKLFF